MAQAPVRRDLPHQIEVAFGDADWAVICELAQITKSPRSAVVRAFVKQGLAPLHATPMPEKYRSALGPVVITSEESLA